MHLSILLVLAAEASVSFYTGPRPEETATFRDWVTGCDNERDCAAIALEVGPGGTDGRIDHLEIVIEQPLANHIGPSVSLKVPHSVAQQANLRLFIDQDDQKIEPPVAGRTRIQGEAARKLVRHMRRGNWALLLDWDGRTVARASLAGLTAALLRIDDQQGKLDTPVALARPGKRIGYDDLPGYSVSLIRPRGSARPPAVRAARSAPEAIDENRCNDTPHQPARAIRLDEASSMLVEPWVCGNGAYNLYSNIIIVDNDGLSRPAAFDYDNGIAGDGPSNVLVNVAWNESKRELESFIRHRGLGDCGRLDRYIWDGKMFRLSEQQVMPECRGSFDRIRTWTVDVADR